MKIRHHSKRCGMTMIEVLVSTAVLSTMLLSAALVTKSGNGVFRTTQARDVLRQQAQRTLDRVADELATASKSTFAALPSAPFGSSSLDFRTPTGINAGVISWSTTSRICFQEAPAPGHSGQNGIYNQGQQGLQNGQGQQGQHGAGFRALEGEGQVVLIRDVGLKSSTTTILASHVSGLLEGETANGKDDNQNGLVDEKGLSFVLAGDQLTIRMTFVNVDADGNAYFVTVQTQIRLRN